MYSPTVRSGCSNCSKSMDSIGSHSQNFQCVFSRVILYDVKRVISTAGCYDNPSHRRSPTFVSRLNESTPHRVRTVDWYFLIATVGANKSDTKRPLTKVFSYFRTGGEIKSTKLDTLPLDVRHHIFGKKLLSKQQTRLLGGPTTSPAPIQS